MAKSYLISEPRMCLGPDSAWYMGTSNDNAPTPSPATKRPTATWYHLPVGEEICTVIPIQTIKAQLLIDHFRPIRSAIGAATRAPIKVPIDSYSSISLKP